MNKRITDDDRCDLDPNKICDNCFKCLEPKAGEDYAEIRIDAVYTGDDYLVDSGSEEYADLVAEHKKQSFKARTLTDCRSIKRPI